MNKEEIEKAKDDLAFFNEGDYITKEMDNSAKILEKYIKELEQKSNILDKVTDYCRKFKDETVIVDDEDEYTDRAFACENILKIIKGEKIWVINYVI